MTYFYYVTNAWKPGVVEQLGQALTINFGIAMNSMDGLRQDTVTTSAPHLHCIDIKDDLPLKTQHD